MDKHTLEAQLKKSHLRYNMVLDVAGEGLWEWHAEEGTVHHNKKWCDILQLDASFLSHSFESFKDLIHPDDQEKVMEAVAKAIKDNAEYTSEHRMIRKDGSVIWVYDRGIVTRELMDGQLSIIGSMRDITQRKEALEALFLEKELFHSTLISIREGVISIDDRQRVILLNPAAEKLTGWKSEAALGRSINEVFPLLDASTKRPLDLEEISRFRSLSLTNLENHALLKTREDAEVAILASVSSIRMPKGDEKGIVITFRDIRSDLEKRQKIEYLSFHDELTGLYNRRYFNDALHRMDTTRNLPFTIMSLDLNNLKIINDTYGHHMGDQILKKAAEILKNVFRSEDILARMGGDEFCILLPRTSLDEAAMIRKRILKAAAISPIGKHYVSSAIGFATKTRDEEDLEMILRQTDAAMYQDKKSSKTPGLDADQ